MLLLLLILFLLLLDGFLLLRALLLPVFLLSFLFLSCSFHRTGSLLLGFFGFALLSGLLQFFGLFGLVSLLWLVGLLRNRRGILGCVRLKGDFSLCGRLVWHYLSGFGLQGLLGGEFGGFKSDAAVRCGFGVGVGLQFTTGLGLFWLGFTTFSFFLRFICRLSSIRLRGLGIGTVGLFVFFRSSSYTLHSDCLGLLRWVLFREGSSVSNLGFHGVGGRARGT